MEGHLLGGLAGQDGAAPDLDQEGGSKGVSSQDGQVEEAIAWNGGGGGGREGAGFIRDCGGDGKDT